MKIYIFPPSFRATALVAIAKHLEIECAFVITDLGRGDQRTSSYAALRSPAAVHNPGYR